MTITSPEPVALPESTDDVVLSVENVSKKFCRNLRQSLFYGIQDITTEWVGGQRRGDRLRRGEFWALKDVSFQLRRGEALGLVGANGAGKSTLLRIISGLIKPDTGKVRFRGRLAPLIALGAGFNPILTGRENIYANMAVLGLTSKQIEERFDAVVEFAEIGDAIDAPVQTYSSGMQARLGFACAIYTEPEILLVDEVLAVGDISFRSKCFRRMDSLRQKGTSIIMVNHNPDAILAICDSAVYLAKGKLVLAGDKNLVIRAYEEDVLTDGVEKTSGRVILPEKPRSKSLGLDIASLYFKDEDGSQVSALTSGKAAAFCIGVRSHIELSNIDIRILIRRVGDVSPVLHFSSLSKSMASLSVSPGYSEVAVFMPYVCLLPGRYVSNIVIAAESLRFLDRFEAFYFSITSEKHLNNCHFYQPHTWKIHSKLVGIDLE